MQRFAELLGEVHDRTAASPELARLSRPEVMTGVTARSRLVYTEMLTAAPASVGAGLLDAGRPPSARWSRRVGRERQERRRCRRGSTPSPDSGPRSRRWSTRRRERGAADGAPRLTPDDAPGTIARRAMEFALSNRPGTSRADDSYCRRRRGGS